ncbi:Hypothetical protein B819_135003 [Klebsiella pneumoniae subsp. pneumoniae KpQ3]|nr:Phosphate starvation-induced protein psiF [Klebsiella pneumoniae 30684/NJST258_2]AHM86779.1 Phosphate starvation-induced protein psiF [Klebsiella pneumoniae 30660/NJST258_1]EKF80304.1 Hypothetical protein B819_135003 [Klebsiella pneumoniae subsp. pneumoniae KpQ3]
MAKLRHRLVFFLSASRLTTFHSQKDGAMKITLLMTLLFGLIFISAVGAAEKTPTPQQQRMTDCNQQASAKMLKGEERKTFMSQCLKKETTTSQGKALTPQQQKMSDCSKAATAKSLKGDERSTFMSSCLKKA